MFGKNLKAIMKQRNLKASELADAIGVSVHIIYKWEENERRIPEEYYLPICDKLDVSVDYLMRYNKAEPIRETFLADFESYALRHFSENTMNIVSYLAKKWEGDFQALVQMTGTYAAVPPKERKDLSANALSVFLNSKNKNEELAKFIDVELYKEKWEILDKK